MSQSWLIVGGTRGIGLGLVEHLVKSHPMDKVYATARNVSHAKELSDLATKSNGRLVMLQGDTSNPASLDKLAKEIKGSNGSLDHIIIVAGIAVGIGKIEEISSKDIEDNISTNLYGVHNAIKALYPLVEASKAPKKDISVISTGPASIALLDVMGPAINKVFHVEEFMIGAYVISKTAVNMLSRVWGLKLNQAGIALPVLHPGSVDTANAKGIDKKDLISPEQSATALVKVIEEADIARTKEGILSYDGSVIPW